jgi:hypothetical protein
VSDAHGGRRLVDVADQPIRVVVEKRRSGCGTVLAVLVLAGLVAEYW